MAATRSLSRFLSHVIPAAVMLVMVLALTVAHGGGVVSGSTDAHVALPVSAHAVTHRQPVALMVPDRVDAPSSTVVAVNDSGTDHDAVASCMLAVAALVGHALTAWKLHRVEIRVATGNARSRAIPERLGFLREGTLREAERHGERFLDLDVFALLEPDWRGAP